jgi:WD40 repeat protein
MSSSALRTPPLPGPFISYSRRDLAFARRLYDALRARNRDAWVDLEGIEPSEAWLEKLHSAIAAAQAFVFVITPDSVSSRYCEDEIRQAAESKKKLIPLLRQPVDASTIPEALARLQWISFLDDERFDANVDDLVRALDTDLDWTHRHTRLLVRSREWNGAGRDRSLLLRGRDLAEAEQWLLDSGVAQDRRPAALQTEFIGASVKATKQSRNRLLSAVTGAAVLALGLSAVALYQRNQAQENERQALSRQLAAQAQATMDTNLGLGMLLALTGFQTRPTFEAQQAVARAMRLRPHLRRFLHGHTGRLHQLSFDSQGEHLASSARDGNVIVWDIHSGQPLVSFHSSSGEPPAIAISAESGLLASSGDHGAIHLRALGNGDSVATLAAHASRVVALAFSPDGHLLASGTAVGRMAIWNTRDRAEQCFFEPTRQTPITALRFDRSGTALGAVDYAGNVRIVDIHRCTVQAQSIDSAGGSFAALSADLSMAAATDAGFPEISVTDLTSGIVSRNTVEGTTNFLLAVDFHPSAERIALGTQGGEVLQLNRDFKRPDQVLRGHGSDVTALSYDLSGQQLASGSIQGEVILWDLRKSSPIEPVKVLPQSGVVTLWFSEDGKSLNTVGTHGDVRRWNIASAAVAESLPGWPAARQVAVSAAADRVALLNGDSIIVRDVRNGTVIARIERSSSTETQLAFSNDGLHLAYIDGGQALVWDVQHEVRVEAGTRKDAHGALAFTPAGDALVYTAGADAVFFDLRTRRTSQIAVSDAKGPVQSLAVSPDGLLLATGGNLYDGSVVLWDIARGTALRTLVGDQLLIARVFFSPDGRTVASVTAFEEALRLWDVATGQPILGPIRLEGFAQQTLGAAFSPDGSWLATAEKDGVVLRDLNPSGWIAALCRSVNRGLTVEEWRSYVGPYDFRATCAERS